MDDLIVRRTAVESLSQRCVQFAAAIKLGNEIHSRACPLRFDLELVVERNCENDEEQDWECPYEPKHCQEPLPSIETSEYRALFEIVTARHGRHALRQFIRRDPQRRYQKGVRCADVSGSRHGAEPSRVKIGRELR